MHETKQRPFLRLLIDVETLIMLSSAVTYCLAELIRRGFVDSEQLDSHTDGRPASIAGRALWSGYDKSRAL